MSYPMTTPGSPGFGSPAVTPGQPLYGFTPGEPVPTPGASDNIYGLSEEELHSIRHCTRCDRYYTINDTDGCYFHPGNFEDPRILSGTQIGWSCCRMNPDSSPVFKSNLNQTAFDRNARGCQFSATHLEDIKFTKTMHAFPFHHKEFATLRERYLEQRRRDRDAAPKKVTKIAKPKSLADLKGHPDYIAHPVLPSDTLFGVALKYGMEVADLKRLNKLMGNDVIGRKVLYIPKTAEALNAKPVDLGVTDAAKKRAMTRKFMDITNCVAEEAGFYLEESEFDLKRAIDMYNEDTAWESGASCTSSS